MTGVLMKRGNWDTEIQRHRHVPCEDEDRGQPDASTNHRTQANPQQLEEEMERVLPPNPQKEPTLQTPCFWASSLQNRETVNVVLSHTVGGTALWRLAN